MSEFERISEHIYIMHAEEATDRPILAAVAGSSRTLLIDGGNSPAHAAAFREYLEREGVRSPDVLVLTHHHWDHSFGLAEWSLPAIAQRQTADILRGFAQLEWNEETVRRLAADGVLSERSAADMRKEYGEDLAGIRVEEPNIVFERFIDVHLGGLTCEIRFVGGDHSADSCIVFVKEEGTLFLGDALSPSVYGGPMKYTTGKFLALLDTIFAYGADVLVESHGRPASREEFYHDVRRYEQLARVVLRRGADRDAVERDLAAELGLTGAEALPEELREAVTYFMNGLSK
ncbi:MBL fold metallo-hydrolase [Saccharibacillus sp. CPCC 101409]|uniref:MBL fold metallo-hydrolase n=1 Tax=Saccharibacillus sp. CPCC 101409 TaxID=3058041 RepID=UPI002672C27C|nr:MBL fold metallo-hydrolase [Saccharibacillus sp. CPCC 101409]MDO3411077.1 MBL fold metallo-hydrolase [Saccharibacillus sp. CPCC 101409]